MTVVNLKWNVDDLATTDLATLVAAGYVEQRIDAGLGELTTPTTRLPLVANCPRYVWQSPNGTVADPFTVRFFKATGSEYAEALLIPPSGKKRRGYCTIQDVRDEGYANPPLSDAAVQRGIDLATAMIDRITRQWFDPRWCLFSFDGERYPEMHLDVPIILLAKATEFADGSSTEIHLPSLMVYNRHLTRGQTNPDDRANPMVSYDEAYVTPRFRRAGLYDSRFARGKKNIRLFGIFGYTELGDSDFVGETADGSQIPLSLGSTPLLIRRAATILAIDKSFKLGSGLASPFSSASGVKEQKTRDQSIEWFKPGDGGGPSGDSGATGIPEVDAILSSFMGPVSIGGV